MERGSTRSGRRGGLLSASAANPGKPTAATKAIPTMNSSSIIIRDAGLSCGLNIDEPSFAKMCQGCLVWEALADIPLKRRTACYAEPYFTFSKRESNNYGSTKQHVRQGPWYQLMRTPIVLPDLGGGPVRLSVWFADIGDMVFEGDRL